MNLFEAGYALGLALMEGESQRFHKSGISPETRHKQQRHGWNLYGGKFDDANEVNAYDRHMDERKKVARRTGKFGAVAGGIAGAGLGYLYVRPALRRSATNAMKDYARSIRGSEVKQENRLFDHLPGGEGVKRPHHDSYSQAVRAHDATPSVVQARRAVAQEQSEKFRRGMGKFAPFARKHAGKLAVGAGLGLGALALGGAAYMKTRWSKDKRAHTYDAKTRSYKPVA